MTVITWITVSSSMIGRICGTSTRSCSCHHPAPSMRAASAVSGGSESSAAVKTTTAKPSCCQMTRPPTETIARCELPSQSCASPPEAEAADGDERGGGVPEPVLREPAEVSRAQRRVEDAVLLQQERQGDSD